MKSESEIRETLKAELALARQHELLEQSRNELRKFSLNDVLTVSPYKGLSTQEATQAIVRDFNQERASIMTQGFNWLFAHDLVKANEFRLVEKNSIPELVGPSSVPLRCHKNLNFVDTSSTLGVFDQASILIGAYGHYVVNVPPGQYAKIYDGTRACLLDSGQHVIHSNNFRFTPPSDNNAGDLVSQTASYIHHNDIHILRVAPGEVAIVKLDNQSFFLESRKEPYVFKTQQFQITSTNANQIFHDAKSKYLTAGTLIRLLPDIGEIGVINTGGRFTIIEPGREQTGPMVKDIGNARFDGFLSVNLQNVEFPSEAARKSHKDHGMSTTDANYDYFYTADSVKVGVRFFVSYRIINPVVTLETLSLHDISKHIEGVVNADMGNAIKQTTMTNLLSSDISKPGDSHSSAKNFKHWQDLVKTKLKDDLNSYGIELVRLNIEEAKILNLEIEKQMSQQAIIVAQADAKKAALEANLAIATAEAGQKRELALLQQETDSELLQRQANARVNAAKLDAEAARVTNQVEINKQLQQAKVLASHPEAMQMAFLQEFTKAVQGGQFSSALPLSDLSNLMANFMNRVGQPSASVLSQSGYSLFAGTTLLEAPKDSLVIEDAPCSDARKKFATPLSL